MDVRAAGIAIAVGVLHVGAAVGCTSDRSARERPTGGAGEKPTDESSRAEAGETSGPAADPTVGEPAPHPKSRVAEPGELGWAPEGRRVVFHTFEESAATYPEWRVYRTSGAGGSPGDLYSFSVEVLYDGAEDRRIVEFDENLAEIDESETVFFGIGGPFTGDDVHLFECGPDASLSVDEPEAETARYHWGMGPFVVECAWPRLYYKVLPDPEGIRVQPDGIEYIDERGSPTEVTIGHDGLPPTPERFAEFWRKPVKQEMQSRRRDPSTTNWRMWIPFFVAPSLSERGLVTRRSVRPRTGMTRWSPTWNGKMEHFRTSFARRVMIVVPPSNRIDSGGRSE